MTGDAEPSNSALNTNHTTQLSTALFNFSETEMTTASPDQNNWFGAASPTTRVGGVSASMARLLREAEGADGSEDYKVLSYLFVFCFPSPKEPLLQGVRMC